MNNEIKKQLIKILGEIKTHYITLCEIYEQEKKNFSIISKDKRIENESNIKNKWDELEQIYTAVALIHEAIKAILKLDV